MSKPVTWNEEISKLIIEFKDLDEEREAHQDSADECETAIDNVKLQLEEHGVKINGFGEPEKIEGE